MFSRKELDPQETLRKTLQAYIEKETQEDISQSIRLMFICFYIFFILYALSVWYFNHQHFQEFLHILTLVKNFKKTSMEQKKIGRDLCLFFLLIIQIIIALILW